MKTYGMYTYDVSRPFLLRMRNIYTKAVEGKKRNFFFSPPKIAPFMR